MIVEKTGCFLPSKLAAELRAADINVAGVTATENDAGEVTAVQIICADSSDAGTIDAVCAAHDPTPAAVGQAPTPQSVVIDALDTIDTSTLQTPADAIDAIRQALQQTA